MKLADTVAALLGPAGLLEAHVPGFVSRPGQVELARAIAESQESGGHLVAEAGTGIGKTYAYLIPILLGGRRAVISTATRALQDQLFERDLPLAGRALGRAARVAVLKGRRNYLCLERYTRYADDLLDTAGGSGPGAETLVAWARSTETGDLAELPGFGEQSAAGRMLTVGADACLGSACPAYARCHVYAARRRAQQADVVIVNHSLLVADGVLKAAGVADLIGDVETVVVDEAHALPDIARESLGEALSFGQLAELARDAGKALAAGAAGPALALAEAAHSSCPLPAGRYGWDEKAALLAPVAEAISEALAGLVERLGCGGDAPMLLARAEALAARLEGFVPGREDATGLFRWLEVRPNGGLSLHAGPLEPGAILGPWIDGGAANWIFTSATLAVAGSMASFIREVGLTSARTLLIGSPFDYQRQARLYLPRGLPDLDDPGYTEAVVEAAEPLIDAGGGGCFLLFTSRQALQRAARWIRARRWRYPLFVQDEAPRVRLLGEFRAAGNGVLCGTASFWEGVDVKGEALVVVVIDRLPFASPADPLLRARLERCRQDGGNPFTEIQLPEAAMALKQGAGRLIRDHADYGVLMICDPRLHTRGYAKTFLASLPPMKAVDGLAEAADFLADRNGRSAACA